MVRGLEILRNARKRLLSFESQSPRLQPSDYERLLQRHQEKFRADMASAAKHFRDGEVDYERWVMDSRGIIQERVADGYRIGLARDQKIKPSAVRLGRADRVAIMKAAQEQQVYFAKFAAHVERQMKDGRPLTVALDARASLYGGGMRSAAVSARLSASSLVQFKWLRHKSDSCSTCLSHEGQIRKASGWREHGVWPSHGTRCDGHCGCTLEPVSTTLGEMKRLSEVMA